MLFQRMFGCFSRSSSGAAEVPEEILIGIPEDLLIDILSRIPAEFFTKIRRVSKYHRKLIDSPYFIRQYYALSIKKLFEQTDNKRLEWNTKMNIALGASKDLSYLHGKARYHGLRWSSILQDEGYLPKLCDFGSHVSTRVMKTYGYCAPEYAMTRQLSLKSDVYSFGVILLEIITGRKAIENEQNLVAWVSINHYCTWCFLGFLEMKFNGCC